MLLQSPVPQITTYVIATPKNCLQVQSTLATESGALQFLLLFFPYKLFPSAF